MPVQASLSLAPLPDRKFVRVQGPDTVSFLQGLMTNDMRHFEHCGTMYTMFLKANGRVFCDTLMYKRPAGTEEHDYLIECDSSVASRLEKHLKLYRLRKKVQVTEDETFRLWVVFQADLDEEQPSESTTPNSLSCPGGHLHAFRDPRLPRLGYRVLADKDQSDPAERLSSLFTSAVGPAQSPLSFTTFRYSLGVGEGEKNLPDGKCFPLECNCDYLHGVSFHKGCYIGQELTARTYHTGVIRKRLMPLEFDSPLESLPAESLTDAEIKNADGAAVGKLRGFEGTRGVGLLRIEKVLPGGQLTLNVGGGDSAIPCRTRKPFWWPSEATARS